MSRLVLISDTHGLHRKVDVPEGDILIHAGDLTNVGEMYDLTDLMLWMKSKPHKHKIVIAGNHDFCFDDGDDRNANARDILRRNGIIYLHDSGCEIDGLKFWGIPYTPVFLQWALMRQRGADIAAHYDLIPDDTDALITHGPPMGILDKAVSSGPNLGCYDLSQAVERIKPQLHVFGHIHGGYGERQYQGVQYVNASCVDESYKPINKVRTIEIQTPTEPTPKSTEPNQPTSTEEA